MLLNDSYNDRAKKFETCLAKLEDSADTIIGLLIDLLTSDSDGTTSSNIIKDYIEGKNNGIPSLLETSRCRWGQKESD